MAGEVSRSGVWEWPKDGKRGQHVQEESCLNGWNLGEWTRTCIRLCLPPSLHLRWRELYKGEAAGVLCHGVISILDPGVRKTERGSAFGAATCWQDVAVDKWQHTWAATAPHALHRPPEHEGSITVASLPATKSCAECLSWLAPAQGCIQEGILGTVVPRSC